MQLSYARLTLAIDFLLALGARSSIFVSGTGARIAQQLQLAETATQSWLSVTRTKSARWRGVRGLGEINAFQRALAFVKPVAQEFFGFWPAYACMGLANAGKRFVAQASAIEPANEKFSVNLINLLRSFAFAVRQNRELMGQLANGTGNPSQPPASHSARPLQLQRIFRSEVRIAAAPPLGASLQSSRLQPFPVINLPTCLTRLERGQPAGSDWKQAAVGQSISPAYPLSIEFSDTSRHMLMRKGEVAAFSSLTERARAAALDLLLKLTRPEYPIRLVL